MFDPFLNRSDPLFNFKLMSDCKLDNQTKMKSDFVPNKLPHITDVPIV